MKISATEIESKKSPKGGWNKKQLAEWGIGWPPPKGWKKALIEGTFIEQVEKIEKPSEEKEWYQYLIRQGYKRIIQVHQGVTIYDGPIEELVNKTLDGNTLTTNTHTEKKE